MPYQGEWKVSIKFSTTEVAAHNISKSWGEKKPEMTTLKSRD